MSARLSAIGYALTPMGKDLAASQARQRETYTQPIPPDFVDSMYPESPPAPRQDSLLYPRIAAPGARMGVRLDAAWLRSSTVSG